MGTRDSFPGVKLPGCEAYHSLPSIAEFKNVWSYTSTPPPPNTPSWYSAQLKHMRQC